MEIKQNIEKIPIKCECGKTLGYLENGIITLKCRTCKRIKAVRLKTQK